MLHLRLQGRTVVTTEGYTMALVVSTAVHLLDGTAEMTKGHTAVHLLDKVEEALEATSCIIPSTSCMGPQRHRRPRLCPIKVARRAMD